MKPLSFEGPCDEGDIMLFLCPSQIQREYGDFLANSMPFA